MNDSVLQFWRGIVGEVPEPEKLGRLSSLNQVSRATVSAARRLGGVRSATGFITSYLQPHRQMFVELFVRDVVFGNADPENWKRGRILVPDWSFADQVTLPREALLESVGGSFSHRITPALDSWRVGVSWVGAPCLPQPDADYLTPIPRNAAGLGSGELEPVTDVVTAIRRWHAARIARLAQKECGMDFSRAESAVAAFAPLSRWTADAKAALEGLVRESRELGQSLSAPPGFRGPEEWFRNGIE